MKLENIKEISYEDFNNYVDEHLDLLSNSLNQYRIQRRTDLSQYVSEFYRVKETPSFRKFLYYYFIKPELKEYIINMHFNGKKFTFKKPEDREKFRYTFKVRDIQFFFKTFCYIAGIKINKGDTLNFQHGFYTDLDLYNAVFKNKIRLKLEEKLPEKGIKEKKVKI